MALTIDQQRIETTSEGFLCKKEDWSIVVGNALAEAHGIELTQEHWELILLLRSYCAHGNEPPSMREYAALIRSELGADKARSIYMMKLFGASPAKMAARLAGLPKPKNCL